MAKNLSLQKAETKSRQVLTLFDESDIEDHEDCSLGSTALDAVLFLGDEAAILLNVRFFEKS